jgi:hypothetical protein
MAASGHNSNPRRDDDEDPYEADSEHEYAALEADEVEAGDRIDDGVIMAPQLVEDAPEQGYPDLSETLEEEQELREMLRESVNRDPEALAADQSRRRSADPLGDLTPQARELFERTTEIRADDLDMEDLAD